MIRDVCFNEHCELDVPLPSPPQFLMVGDVDKDDIDEIILCDRLGTICVFKEMSKMCTWNSQSNFPICHGLIRTIDEISKTPLIILLSVVGVVTMLHYNRHPSASEKHTPVDDGLFQTEYNTLTPCLQLQVNPSRLNSECCCDIFTHTSGISVLTTTCESNAEIFRYVKTDVNDNGHTSSFQKVNKLQLNGNIASLTNVNDFTVFGTLVGSIHVYLLKENFDEDVDESSSCCSMMCSKVPVALNREPPYSACPGSVHVEALCCVDEYSTKAAPHHMFAAVWLDGRVCISDIVAAGAADNEHCWCVLKCLHSNFPFFDVHFAKVTFEAIEDSLSRDDLSSSEVCESISESIMEDVDIVNHNDSLLGDQVDHQCAQEESLTTGLKSQHTENHPVIKIMLVAAARSGHMVLVSLPLRELQTQQYIDESAMGVFCFDSNHKFKAPCKTHSFSLRNLYDTRRKRYWERSAGLKSFACGHLFFSSTYSSSIDVADKASDIFVRHHTGMSFVYLNSMGKVNIVRDSDDILKSIGPSDIDHYNDFTVYKRAEIHSSGWVMSFCDDDAPERLHVPSTSTESVSKSNKIQDNVASVGRAVLERLRMGNVEDLRHIDDMLQYTLSSLK